MRACCRFVSGLCALLGMLALLASPLMTAPVWARGAEAQEAGAAPNAAPDQKPEEGFHHDCHSLSTITASTGSPLALSPAAAAPFAAEGQKQTPKQAAAQASAKADCCAFGCVAVPPQALDQARLPVAAVVPARPLVQNWRGRAASPLLRPPKTMNTLAL